MLRVALLRKIQDLGGIGTIGCADQILHEVVKTYRSEMTGAEIRAVAQSLPAELRNDWVPEREESDDNS